MLMSSEFSGLYALLRRCVQTVASKADVRLFAISGRLLDLLSANHCPSPILNTEWKLITYCNMFLMYLCLAVCSMDTFSQKDWYALLVKLRMVYF